MKQQQLLLISLSGTKPSALLETSHILLGKFLYEQAKACCVRVVAEPIIVSAVTRRLLYVLWKVKYLHVFKAYLAYGTYLSWVYERHCISAVSNRSIQYMDLDHSVYFFSHFLGSLLDPDKFSFAWEVLVPLRCGAHQFVGHTRIGLFNVFQDQLPCFIHKSFFFSLPIYSLMPMMVGRTCGGTCNYEQDTARAALLNYELLLGESQIRLARCNHSAPSTIRYGD